MNTITPATIRLYHTTCKSTLEQITSSGLGLDHHDFYNLYYRLKDFFNVPDHYLLVVGIPETMHNTHFYTTLHEAKAHPLDTATCRSNYVEALVSRVSHFLQRPFREFQDAVQSILNDSTERVVLVVDAPLDGVTRTASGVYQITKKLPFEAVCKIIPLG